MTARGNAVPEPQTGDSDGVITALESAEIFRSRGDLSEAARWLRRGAEIAGDEGNDQRALALAQAAVNLGSGAPVAETAAEEPQAPVDDIMAELFDQPIAPALKARSHEPATTVAAPSIPPPAPLPSIPEPPSLLDSAPQAAAAPLAAPAVVTAPTLPRPALTPSEPPRDNAPSSLPAGPPLRPSGIVSVTAAPPAPSPPKPEPELLAAAVPEFDDNTPATVPQTDTSHLKRTAIWADQEELARAMAREPLEPAPAPPEEPTEPGQTWEDQTQSESTSAKWATAAPSAPGVPLRSEPPPKPPRAPTLSKLDIEWEGQSAPRVEGTPVAAAPTAPAAPAVTRSTPVRTPQVVRAVPTTRRALRGTLQATTEDGVFVFVPLSAQQRPELHTHEAVIVLVSPNANLEA